MGRLVVACDINMDPCSVTGPDVGIECPPLYYVRIASSAEVCLVFRPWDYATAALACDHPFHRTRDSLTALPELRLKT